MNQYVVSARRYRPQLFRDVIGQEAAVKTLKNALKTGQLAHAFLFCGPRGVGKTTCARLLAKAINCQQLTAEIEPCNTCQACTSFNKQASFNIYELDAASNNSVEDVRSLVDQVRYPPQYGLYKVYIIDEVHMLSQAAFNAFLKTLEEPPTYAIFILATTEKHKVLPTILSRCQIFDFQRISPAGIVEQLKQIAQAEGITCHEEALYLIGNKADGALRDALSMFDMMVNFGEGTLTYAAALETLHMLDYSYYFRLIPMLVAGSIPDAFLLYEEIMQQGFDGMYFLEGLLEHFRNLLVAKDPHTVSLLTAAISVQEKYQLQAQALSPDYLLAALARVSTALFQYKESINKRFHVELLLLSLAKQDAALCQPPTDTTPPLVTSPATSPTTKKATAYRDGTISPSPTQPKETTTTSPTAITQQLDTDNSQAAAPPVAKVETVHTAPATTPGNTLVNNEATIQSKKQESLQTTIKIPQISSIKATLKKNTPPPTLPSSSTQTPSPLVAETIALHLQAYAQRYKAAKKIPAYNLLQNSFQMEGDTIQLGFKHTVEGHILSEIKEELVDYLRQQLQHPSVTVTGILLPDENTTPPKPYTAQEKFRYLIEKNPALGLIKELLQLEEIV